MSPRHSWINGRVDILLAALADLGMSTSRTAATEVIDERLRWVSSQLGMSRASARRYLTDDALVDLARTMAFSVAEETPGADVLDSARTAAVPLAILGRAISGLAVAIQVRLNERDEVEHLRTTTGHLAQALSSVGLVASQAVSHRADGQVVVMMPPGLVNRVARYLQATATLVADDGIVPTDFDRVHAGQLADTLAEDAETLRSYADEGPARRR